MKIDIQQKITKSCKRYLVYRFYQELNNITYNYNWVANMF